MAKHSGAKAAKVELVGDAQTIHLRVSDAGAGFKMKMSSAPWSRPDQHGRSGCAWWVENSRSSPFRGRARASPHDGTPGRGRLLDTNLHPCGAEIVRL